MPEITKAAESHKPMTVKRAILRVLLYFVALDVCVITLYPYFTMICTALKSHAEVSSANGTVFPITAVWANFVDIWTAAPMAKYLLNSVLVAGGSMLLAMICGIPAAYALAHMKFKGKTAFLCLIVVSQIIAPIVLVVGIYRLMASLGLADNIVGLMFINAAFNQGFTIWLLRGTFMSISGEIEEAAIIDGYSRVQAMLRVLLPVAAPGIITAMIFIFINAWNEYTMALTLISTEASKPITAGMNIFSSNGATEWQYLFAASLFAVIPAVILFIAIEKNLVKGLIVGGIKD